MLGKFRNWAKPLLTLAGTALAVLIYLHGEWQWGLLVIVGTLTLAFATPDSLGSPPAKNQSSEPSATAIKKYRESHPGTSISAAIAALHHGTEH